MAVRTSVYNRCTFFLFIQMVNATDLITQIIWNELSKSRYKSGYADILHNIRICISWRNSTLPDDLRLIIYIQKYTKYSSIFTKEITDVLHCLEVIYEINFSNKKFFIKTDFLFSLFEIHNTYTKTSKLYNTHTIYITKFM